MCADPSLGWRWVFRLFAASYGSFGFLLLAVYSNPPLEQHGSGPDEKSIFIQKPPWSLRSKVFVHGIWAVAMCCNGFAFFLPMVILPKHLTDLGYREDDAVHVIAVLGIMGMTGQTFASLVGDYVKGNIMVANLGAALVLTPKRLIDLGYKEDDAVHVIAVFGIMGMTGQAFSSVVGDKVKGNIMVVILTVASVLTVNNIIAAYSTSLTAVYVYCAASGFFLGLYNGVYYAVNNEIMDGENVYTLFMTMRFSKGVGGTAGPYIAGMTVMGIEGSWGTTILCFQQDEEFPESSLALLGVSIFNAVDAKMCAATSLGWRWVFRLFAASYGSFGFLLLGLYCNDPLEQHEDGPDEKLIFIQKPSWSLRSKVFIHGIWAVAMCCEGFAFFLPMVIIPRHLTDVGYKEDDAVHVIAVLGIMGMTGQTFGSLVGDYVKGNIMVANLAEASVLTVNNIIAAYSTSLTAVYVYCAASGFFLGLYNAGHYAANNEIMDGENVNTLFMTMRFTGGVGGTAGPYIAGYIRDVTGSYYAVFLSIVSCYGVFVLATLLLICYKKWKVLKSLEGKKNINSFD
ncbi:monocarboxylate transporter 13-like [Lingula anatina]|uniref:Monocarboxylate transporter 13-like n=1 Tax=Lingula anatina TaxID=7574 RepID=A0A1S3I2N8_LINAN|nr:monocarboxylate transporter 13-like [Lingula anatina]|eukprot:XP_013392535.1 monocarboxylate transporter 13-like [Lingula anatina]